MPTRFERYRMRDGVTPLSEGFFNGVFGDIDARIAELEARRADLQSVVDELTKFGLQRIDTLVGPSMAEVTAMLEQLRQRRDELEDAIGNVGDLATQTQLSALADELGDTLDAVALTVQALAAGKVGTVNGQQGPNVTLKPSHLALGPANGASAVVLARDAQSRLSTVTRTVDGKPAVQTLTYDAQGRVDTVTTTYDGRTRTETLIYGASGLESVAATEVQA
jgi:YD repeat-containing protein